MAKAPIRKAGRPRANHAQPPRATSSFYDPNPSTLARTPLSIPPNPSREAIQDHVDTVQAQAEPLVPGMSVDADDTSHRAPPEVATDPQSLASEIERIRAIRKPLGAFTQKLALPPIAGYHQHWFNDTAGRLDEARANGWAFVTGNDGKPVSRVVGSGRDNGALRAYAMKIPEVFWREDMAARHAEAASRIEQLKASPFRAQPGQAQKSDTGKFYSPQEDAAPISVVKG